MKRVLKLRKMSIIIRSNISRRHLSLLQLCLFVAVFGSSIVGAKIGSVSLNKISLMPLLVFFLFSYLIEPKPIFLNYLNKKQLCWYCVSILSCLVGLFRQKIELEFDGYTNNLINYSIQIIAFYLPLILLIASYRYKEDLFKSLKNSLNLTCRIQMVWALLQFIFYTSMHYDLNKQILVNIMGGMGRESWTNFLWNYGAPVLRISGLNYDGAFLGYILLIGLIFDDVKIFKIMYIATILVSLQRSALLGVVIISTYLILNKIAHLRSNTSLIPIIKSIVTVLVFVIAFIVVLHTVPVVNDYFTKFIDRFDFLHRSSAELSTSSSRHILYLPYSVISLFSIDPIVFLIGIGPRSSGIALTLNAHNLPSLILDANMKTSVWAIECDFAEVLLGSGILGAIFYCWTCWDVYNNGTTKIKTYIVLLIGIGLMYGFSHLTLTHLLLMFLYLFERWQMK